jgi:membrane associated rhomboid family serine protease
MRPMTFVLFILPMVFLVSFTFGTIASLLGASPSAIIAAGALFGFGSGIVFARKVIKR